MAYTPEEDYLAMGHGNGCVQIFKAICVTHGEDLWLKANHNNAAVAAVAQTTSCTADVYPKWNIRKIISHASGQKWPQVSNV